MHNPINANCGRTQATLLSRVVTTLNDNWAQIRKMNPSRPRAIAVKSLANRLSGSTSPIAVTAAVFVAIVFCMPSSSASAATQGPLSPSSCVNTAGIGTKAWAPSPGIPESVSLDVNTSQISNYLVCTGYSFSIPAGSVINGITVTINRKANQAACCQDAAIRIVKGGAIGATDRSSAANWPTVFANQIYGNAIDLWGTAWTVANINAANFGAAVAATGNNGNGTPTVTVNNITITVDYTSLAAPTVAKSFAPTNVPTQGSSTLTITLTNSNASAITGAAFTDTYPAGLVNAAAPAGATTCAGGTVTAAAGGNTVALSGGTIPASGSCTVTVSVTSASAGSYANNVPIGAVTSTNAPANTAPSNTATLTVLNRPGVAKLFGTNPMTVGGTSLLTITLSNTNAVSITGAAFTDTYPAGITNSTTASTTCGGSATAVVNGGTVALSGGTIPTGGSCTVTVTVKASAAGSYANSIAVGAVTSANAGSNTLAASDTLTVNPAVSSFDAVEVAAAPQTNLYTKLSGVPFSVDILALDASNAVSTTYTGTVSLTLVDGSSSGTCTLMTSLQALGNQTFTGGNAGRKTVAITYANAARNVRIRINDSTLGITSCSFDAFAIRPSGMASVTSNMTNSATTGAPFVNAGGFFTLTATAIAGYNGTPAVDNAKITAHAGATQSGTISGVFSVAVPASGVATGSTFSYSEVGNFQFQTQGVYDDTFTAVDQPNDCTSNFSNALVGGKYGCKFGTSAATSFFGRFTPDNFVVSSASLTNRGELACAPASSFTYMGEPIGLGFTLTAKNIAGNTTQNYTTASGFAQLNPALPRYFNFVTKDTAQTSLRTFVVSAITRANPGQVTTSSAHGFATGQQVYITGAGGMTQINGQLVNLTVVSPTSFTVGIDTSGYSAFTSGGTVSRLAGLTSSGSWSSGSVTVSATVALQRARSPDGPYTALNVAMAPSDDDGIGLLSGLLTFDADNNGINDSFSFGATEARFGRLKLGNAFGSELLDLPIPMETQYLNSSGVYVTNVDDSCTAIVVNNVFLSSGTASVGGAFVAGKGNLKITKPLSKVSIDLCIDLDGPSPTDPSCVAATPANKPWLQWKWSGATFDKDPKARATFGVFKNADQFIYLRENF